MRWVLSSAWVYTWKDSVRSKPYEILEAAEQCAEMARKAGWEDVEIIEVKRVVNDQGGQGAIA